MNLDNYIIIKNIPRNNDMDFNIRLNSTKFLYT